MAEAFALSPARSGVVLGLTYFIVGLTFALPFPLIPEDGVSALSDRFSPEVGNVYACVAWAGWAHFLFAFRGQGSALRRMAESRRRSLFYLLAIAVTILVLLGTRQLLGASIFGAIVWVYFIDHFLKSEQVFAGKPSVGSAISRWLASYQPLMSFGWLTVVLMNPGNIAATPWFLWVVSASIGATILFFGGWKNLTSGNLTGPLLSLFFVGEALVWGTVGRYASPTFMAGVYVFHIAAGSYFHYLGSYFVANARQGERDKLLRPGAVVLINLAVVGLGVLSAWLPALAWLRPILGIEWFSLWVALHLVTSDLFPLFKRRANSVAVPLQEAA